MDTQFKKGVLEICVLALLSKRDHYGYELVSDISQTISISEGTIYPLLRRLKNEEYVETYLQESSDGPPRKYYCLTDKGREAGQTLFDEWKIFNESVNQLLKGLIK